MKRLWPICLLIVLLAVVFAYEAGRRHQAVQAVPSTQTPAKAPVLYWYDPMVPGQHFDKPGLSPMGMEMVPKLADATAPKDVVNIDAATVQNLGVRTARVERRALHDVVQVPGTITWDVRQAVTVSARVEAIVTRLDVRAPYTVVAANAPLAELLAPQWNSAIAEADALQHAQSMDAKALRDAAQQRLQVLGLSVADIHALDHRRGQPTITLHAPQAGVVTSLDVRDGQRVSAGQTLMTINGLFTVWVEAALPQAVAGTVRADTPVSIRVDALPGRVFEGKVETLLPDIDVVTRTQRARIVLANPDFVLSPGMFVHVELAPVSSEVAWVIPDEALMAVGGRTRVIVMESDGRFRPVAVRTGRSADGYTQVLSGLSGHEKVVTSAQFLIDSEASLSGALERMGDDSTEPSSSTSASTPAMPMEDER